MDFKQIKIEIIKKLLVFLQQLQKELFGEKGFWDFAEALGERESGGDYKIVNTLGYLGKWQFGLARLADFGYCERIPGTTGFGNDKFRWKAPYSKEGFLNSPTFQQEVFKLHVKNLVKAFESNPYLGLYVAGVKITLSGCVAMSHLAGVSGTKRFLTTGGEFSDAYGTSIAEYGKLFADYNLSEVG